MQHCLKISRAICGSVPFSQALIKALYVITSGRRPWCNIVRKSSRALCGSGSDQSVVSDHIEQEALVHIDSKCCKALCGSEPFRRR